MAGVWYKPSISHKIVPWNLISKSIEDKHFTNVCFWPDIAKVTITWAKLMQLGVLFSFFCHFMTECFHTLKFESDFYSRQGHWTLSRTGVYDRILLQEKQRRSSFLFFLENGILLFFVVSLCWNIFYSYLITKRKVNLF